MRESSFSHNRYRKPLVNSLVQQIEQCARTQQMQKNLSVCQKRKMNYSFSASLESIKKLNSRPLFNNKTKQGELLQKQLKPIPYLFIPKYKNETFIMPDRVFSKGKDGKRFQILMKNSSIFSFNSPQNKKMRLKICRQQKQKTIISRKLQQFDRIVDFEDGKVRAKNNINQMRNTKNFGLSDAPRDKFSICEPLLGQREAELSLNKKTTLRKSFDYNNKWKPITRKSSLFEQPDHKSLYSHKSRFSSFV